MPAETSEENFVTSKKHINPLEILEIVLIIIFAYLMNQWKGPALAVLVFLMWIDKNYFTRLKFEGEFGIELETLTSVLAGLIYGPFFGFVFGFLFWTFLGGFFEIIAWAISPPYAPNTFPFVPSIETLVGGLSGALAGFVGPIIPLVLLITIASIIRNLVIFMKDQIIGWPPRLAYFSNILFNIIIVLAFQPYLDSLLRL